MKFKLKIIATFFISLVTSLFVFLVVIWYLVNNGWWSGINLRMMNAIADAASGEVRELDSFNADAILPILNRWKAKLPGIEIELDSFQTNAAVTTARTRQVATVEELLKSLSIPGDRRVAAREILFNSGEKVFLAVIVPDEYYSAITYSINNGKGTGIFGIMCLIGLGITIVISFASAIVFSKQISKRFDRLNEEIAAFDLTRLDIDIRDNSRDEIGHLAKLVKMMSERLKKQVLEEKSYQEERKRLISNLSHDLRTPLTSIVGFSESLENGVYEDEDERRKYLSIIHRKALYMEKLLGQLLYLSRLESGNYELIRREIDAAELVREILIEYLPVLQDRGMELAADIPDEPLAADLDKESISRVIRNLMDNAVKYSPDGGKIGFTLTDAPCGLQIEISDNGKGIDEKDLGLIFNRYYRVDKTRNKKDEGTGLGLAIADEIVKLHGGKIELISETGRGSTFTVILPKRAP